MTVLFSGTPTRGCRCAPCRRARTQILDRLTAPQRACLEAVDRRLPRHPEDIKDRAGITANTIRSLVAPRRACFALVTEVRLSRWLRDDQPIPFLILTDLGRDVTNPELRG